MERIALHTRLKPGKEAEYDNVHAVIPPELDIALRAAGVHSWRIWRDAQDLLHLVDVEAVAAQTVDAACVTSLAPQLLLDALSFVVDLHRDDAVLEFPEVRRILDPAATALAAQRMSGEEIAASRAAFDDLDDEPSVDALVANDLESHRRIAAGVGNGVLCSLIDGLSGPTTRARVWRGLTQRGAVAKTREKHAAIPNAITAQQPEVARSIGGGSYRRRRGRAAPCPPTRRPRPGRP
ncbi:FCD domain-containing protein [Micromonospora sp. SL1-18]|uniref:FCD domain-containing protein n=1 Tax=Micromonospora sp. SL1-18 TaxID=3399128 RepID=UPI003A4DC0F5